MTIQYVASLNQYRSCKNDQAFIIVNTNKCVFVHIIYIYIIIDKEHTINTTTGLFQTTLIEIKWQACRYKALCIWYQASRTCSTNSKILFFFLSLLMTENEQVNVPQRFQKFLFSKGICFQHSNSSAVTCRFKDTTLSCCKVFR